MSRASIILDARTYIDRLVELGSRLDAPGAPIATEDLSAFRNLIIPNASRLLDVVAGSQLRRLRNLDAELRAWIDALGTPIDMLGFLGLARDEVSHTRVLASFLNSQVGSPFPRLASACGDALEKLLHTVDCVPSADLGFAAAVAHDQHVLVDGNRADVLIDSGRCVCFLEAKIDAEERNGQLDDYARELAKRSSEHKVLAYLTLHPHQKPKTKAACAHITFEDLLRAWLPVATTALPGSDDLKRYMKTLAMLYGFAGPGRFEHWPLHVQRACIDMVQGVTR